MLHPPQGLLAAAAARRLAEISYEEVQEAAEAGAKALNAQAVEFAKERGIAIYARASDGGGETIAGINAQFRTLRRTLEILREMTRRCWACPPPASGPAC